MISENQIKSMIEDILSKMEAEAPVAKEEAPVCTPIDDANIPDITALETNKIFNVPNPENEDAYMKLKERTPARVGIWRAGPRYRTETLLRFRADHAVAQDAVFNNVSDEFIKDIGEFSVNTVCKDKDEYLTRPDLGRKFDEEAIKTLKEKCKAKPRVQIYVSDGLSSTAVETNAKDAIMAIQQGLRAYNIEMGTPFFVKYGRVPAMDAVSEVLDAEVTVVLIGERPGLATGESMSCYMAYKATVGMPESNRTVISNIHKGGTPAAEAGAHIADIIKKMLDNKASGLDLKL
ncbi:ethanolamine ammonia-lyase subunit EutC [Vallitalea okinawensis]|uniref:ethanolamine ammonia-lyase subunit EutC n=1 Tax=Vallitalea okinawensis TaxID=2078660 RepID=UPI001FA8FD8D|nr:ethanolamine ammonia-lyase subunit EutC [Vallitalea okinawensis]